MAYDPGGKREALLLLDEAQTLVAALLPEVLSLRSEIRWKPDGSPVTEADILMERKLEDLFRARLPGVVFIGEESFGGEADAACEGWAVVIDPIDGTENFCSGLREWGVSLSIWRGGEHQASQLLLPELGESLRSGQKIERISSRIVGLSSSLPPTQVAELGATAEVRVMGCAVYNLYNVARGAYQRFMNPKGARTWDLLAGLNIALEQGCSVLVEGKPYHGEYLPAHRRYRIDICN